MTTQIIVAIIVVDLVLDLIFIAGLALGSKFTIRRR